MEWILKEHRNTRKTSKEWRLVKTKDGVAVEYKDMQRIKPVLSEKVEKVEKKEEAVAATEHTCGQSKKEEAVNTNNDEKRDSCLSGLKALMESGEVDDGFKKMIEEVIKSCGKQKEEKTVNAKHTCGKK